MQHSTLPFVITVGENPEFYKTLRFLPLVAQCLINVAGLLKRYKLYPDYPCSRWLQPGNFSSMSATKGHEPHADDGLCHADARKKDLGFLGPKSMARPQFSECTE